MKNIVECVEMNKEQDYVINIYEDIDLSYPMHYHPKDYELAIHLGCKGTRVIGDHIAPFDTIDMVLLAPRVPHCWYGHSEGGDYREQNAKVFVIQFNEHFIGEHLQRSDFRFIKNLFKDAEKGIEVLHETKHRLVAEVLKLKAENSMEQYLQLLNILHQLSILPQGYKKLCSAIYTFNDRKNKYDTFDEVHQYIVENYKHKIKLSEAAQLVNMSESAFSHYFKKRTFKSFSQFVNELRVGYAARVLMETDKTISEAAFESGFNNLSNFNRIFKKVKNCSPTDFRNKINYEN